MGRILTLSFGWHIGFLSLALQALGNLNRAAQSFVFEENKIVIART